MIVLVRLAVAIVGAWALSQVAAAPLVNLAAQIERIRP